MNVLFVFGPGGHLQTVAAEHAPGYAETLRAWKEPQGCRVEVLTMAEYRARRGLGERPTISAAPPISSAPVLPLPYAHTRLHRLALVRLRATWAARLRAQALGARRAVEYLNPHLGTNPFAWDCEGEVYARANHFASVYSWRTAQEGAARLAGNRGLAEELLFGDRTPGAAEDVYAPFRRVFADAFAHRPDNLLCHRPLSYWRDTLRGHNEAHQQRQAALTADWQAEIRRCPTPSGFGLAGLPWLDEAIVHPALGPCRVTHMLFFQAGAPDVRSPFSHEDHWRPVACGPRGSALVFPGQWEAGPQEAPAPAAPDATDMAQQFAADRVYPAPTPSRHADVAAPKAAHMPSLFE